MRMTGKKTSHRFFQCFLFGLCFLLIVGVVAVSTPATAFAQDAKKGGPEKVEQVGMFTHIIGSLGLFFQIVFLVLSIILVTLIVLSALDLRLGGSIPPAFVDEFTDLVNKRQFRQAFEACREDTSYLARVMTSGMGRLQYGIDDAREASLNSVEAIKASKDQLVNYVGTIGTLGPLLGLLGTVTGMIAAFQEIAATGVPDPTALAGDISQALATTLVGVFIAVFAIFFNSFFRNRLNTISNDTGNLADDLLTQMYHNSRKQGGGTPGAETRTSTAAIQQPKA